MAVRRFHSGSSWLNWLAYAFFFRGSSPGSAVRCVVDSFIPGSVAWAADSLSAWQFWSSSRSGAVDDHQLDVEQVAQGSQPVLPHPRADRRDDDRCPAQGWVETVLVEPKAQGCRMPMK